MGWLKKIFNNPTEDVSGCVWHEHKPKSDKERTKEVIEGSIAILRRGGVTKTTGSLYPIKEHKFILGKTVCKLLYDTGYGCSRSYSFYVSFQGQRTCSLSPLFTLEESAIYLGDKPKPLVEFKETQEVMDLIQTILPKLVNKIKQQEEYLEGTEERKEKGLIKAIMNDLEKS